MIILLGSNLNVQEVINNAPSGTVFVINETLTANITVTGKDNLVFTGSGTLKLVSGTTVFTATNCKNLILDGITFDGNNSGTNLVDLENCPGFGINNCRIINVGAGTNQIVGIYIAPGCDNGTVFGCKFENFLSNGVTRGVSISNYRDNTKYSKNIKITGNYFNNLQPAGDGDGVVFDQTGYYANGLVANNSFDNCYKRAVKIIADGVTVTGNIIKRDDIGQGYAAISAYGEYIDIIGNKIYCSGNASYYALIDALGDDISIMDNVGINSPTSPDTSKIGVFIEKPVSNTDVQNINIKGNTFKNLQYGVKISSTCPSKEVSIEGNTFLECSSHIINIGASVNGLTITGNHSNTSPHYFVIFNLSGVTGKNRITIVGNTCNASWGIVNFSFGIYNWSGGEYRPKEITVRGNISGNSSNDQYDRGKLIRWSNGIPTSGNVYEVGDVIYNQNVAPGTNIGWVCTNTGDPGTWKTFGAVQS